MYRLRLYQQVIYGRYKEFLAAVEELNANEESKGRVAITVWTPTVGENNLVALESEYPDLDSLQKDLDAFGQDADAMRVYAEMSSLSVQGSSRSELWESTTSVV